MYDSISRRVIFESKISQAPSGPRTQVIGRGTANVADGGPQQVDLWEPNSGDLAGAITFTVSAGTGNGGGGGGAASSAEGGGIGSYVAGMPSDRRDKAKEM